MRRRRRLRRREKKHRNKVIVMSLVGLVLLLSCGYAAFSTQLNLTAKGTIKTKLFKPTITDGTVTFKNSCSQFTCTIYSDSIDGGSTITTEKSTYLSDSNYIIATISDGTNSETTTYSNYEVTLNSTTSNNLLLTIGTEHGNNPSFPIEHESLEYNIVTIEQGVTENQDLMYNNFQEAYGVSGISVSSMIETNEELAYRGLTPDGMIVSEQFMFGVTNSSGTAFNSAKIKNLLIKLDSTAYPDGIKFIASFNSENGQWELVNYTQIEDYVYISDIQPYKLIRFIISAS